MANHTLFIDEIHCRPVPVAIAILRRAVVVDGDGEANVVFLDILLHLRKVAFVGELRRMHADDHEPLIRILLMPLLHIGFDISAVVATEGPELDHHDLALQVGQMQGRAVQPGLIRFEFPPRL
jgi:hypothetical protein